MSFYKRVAPTELGIIFGARFYERDAPMELGIIFWYAVLQTGRSYGARDRLLVRGSTNGTLLTELGAIGWRVDLQTGRSYGARDHLWCAVLRTGCLYEVGSWLEVGESDNPVVLPCLALRKGFAFP